MICYNIQISENKLERENIELTEENAKLESDRKMLQSVNTQLIEEKHQLETSVMQLQAENNQLKTESNQLMHLKTDKNQHKIDINRLKAKNNQLRDQLAAEKNILKFHHKKEKLRLESCHQREKRILQSEVEQLTKELKDVATVSVDKNLLVSILYYIVPSHNFIFVEAVQVLKKSIMMLEEAVAEHYTLYFFLSFSFFQLHQLCYVFKI